jgi:hypothetical protein
MEKCDLCPLNGRDIACIDQITGHGHFCRRLVEVPGLAGSVVWLSEKRAGIAVTEKDTSPPQTSASVSSRGHKPNGTAPYIAARLAICRACPLYQAGPPERCGELVKRGKAGLLMHPRGVPNPNGRCPLGKYGPEAEQG